MALTRRTEDGSALVAVLALVVVLSVMAGAVLSVRAAQRRLLQREVHRLQATYAAEAGLAVALRALEGRRAGDGFTEAYRADGGAAADVRVTPFGLFTRVESAGAARGAHDTLRALVGEAAPAAYDDALVVADPDGGLTLADTAVVEGPVAVGVQGTSDAVVAGRPFRGRLSGPVRAGRTAALPAYDPGAVRAALDRAEAWAAGAGPLPVVRVPERVTVREVPERASVLVGTGAVRLEGPLRLPPGTVVLAAAVTTTGPVRLRHALLVGRDSVVLGAGASGDAQLLARGTVRVAGGAHLTYPSAVAALGEGARAPGVVRIQTGALVEGLVVGPPPRGANEVPPRVEVAAGAVVRGAVLAPARATLEGLVEGSLFAAALEVYRAPTLYVNWLVGGSVRRGRRPDSFVLPAGFGDAGRPRVLLTERPGEGR